MAEIFRGLRPGDWLLAGALTVLGAVLMLFNIIATGPDPSMAHPIESHSPWMLPVFAAATVPVLWWRRDVLAAASVSLAVMVAHDLLFGWVTRCGVGLPLAFVYAFLGSAVLRAYQSGGVPGGRGGAHGGRAGAGRVGRPVGADPGPATDRDRRPAARR